MTLQSATLLLWVVAGGQVLAGGGDDWYPDDITPPPGTRYPCALTALPRALPGVPDTDRRFVNHAYSLILRATQAKLVLLRALERGPDDAALGTYLDRIAEGGGKLRAEPTPPGLEPFRDDVLAAFRLQRAFFEKANAARDRGESYSAIFGIAEGRQASARLISAWGRMQRRYPDWPPETRDSIYHHLCALDLF